MNLLQPKLRRHGALAALALALISTPCLATIAPATSSSSAAMPAAASAYGKLPIRFEPNVGQAPTELHYVAHTGGYSLGLASHGAVLAFAHDTRLSLTWLDAQARPALHAEQPQGSTSNYFIGKDPGRWHAKVANYGAVRYEGLYPGIDWRVYGNPRQLEYDLILAPQADPSRLRLQLAGATTLDLDGNGDLLLQTGGHTLRQLKPVIYQEGPGGERQLVEGGYRLDRKHRQVAFALGSYDHSRQLVIDPVLAYSTYLGGSEDDYAEGIAVDSAGSAYVTGYTTSADFPTAGPVQKSSGGGSASGSVCACDAFIAKLSPDGSTLQYATYLGGSGDDYAYAVAVNSAGEAYVVGSTTSTDFPMAHALQDANKGGADAFAVKLSADGGTLEYATYLGGKGDDRAHAVAVDSAGNAYVAGYTDSTRFPTAAPQQKKIGGGYDAFVAKITTAGSLSYATYLGGSGDDYAYAIAVDSAGNAYTAGATTSSDFPLANPLPGQNHMTADYDGFVTKLSADGSSLQYSTYLGGNEDDHIQAIAVDNTGAAYVAGYTTSPNLPVAGPPLQASNAGGYDAFVAKLIPDGSSLQYATYLGGGGNDYAYGIAVDGAGSAYVVGYTASANFPVKGASQAAYAGGQSDAFIAALNANGGSLRYATYLGGRGGDSANAIAVDGAGNAYIAGATTSTDFPVAKPYRNINEGGNDAFASKLSANGTAAESSDGGGGAASPAVLALGLAAWARRKRKTKGTV